MKQFPVLSFALCCAAIFVAPSCQKKTLPPRNTFSVSGSPGDVFENAVKEMQTQGFDMEEFEKGDRRFKTTLKKLSVADLQSYATFVQPIDRYIDGRYGYRVQVTADGDNASVKIEPVIEGLYVPRQEETPQLGTVNQWQPGTTTGVLERMLADALK